VGDRALIESSAIVSSRPSGRGLRDRARKPDQVGAGAIGSEARRYGEGRRGTRRRERQTEQHARRDRAARESLR
jgi:hypothetical protein